MMPRRAPETLVDWLVVGIAPFLIMLLVGSLVFYLVEVFYLGEYQFRLLWVLGLFVMAVVCIARISMEEGAAYASLYAAPLAGAVGLALAAFVEVRGPLAAFGPALNWMLMGLVWWAAHKLTWDCTLIEGGRDFTGQGLMQTTGLDRFFRIKTPDARPPEPEPAAPPEPEGTTTATPAPTLPVWEWWKQRNQRPHAPGVWVVYFSIAALPLFGLGQWFIPESNGDLRRRAFWLLVVYVAAGLSLLMSTSFLSLRRYLQQRNLQMPGEMAAVWLGTGTAIVFILLILASLLPRPAPEYSITHLAPQIKAPERTASRWGWGKEGAKSKPNASHTATSGAQSQHSPPTGNQGTPKPGTQGGQQPGQSTSSQSNSSQSSSGGQNNNDSSNQSQNQQQQQNSGNANPADPNQQNSSNNQPSNLPSDPANQNQQGQNQQGPNPSNPNQQNQNQNPDQSSQQPSSDPSKNNPGNSNSNQQPQQNSTPQNNNQPPPPESSSPPESNQTPPLPNETTIPPPRFSVADAMGQVFAYLMHALKWLFYLAVAAIIAYYCWKHREWLLAAWEQLLKELRELWAKWFGQPIAAPTAEPVAAAPLPKRFAEYADPFATGLAARWSLAELVRYTFEALEARGRDQNCPRNAEQTPLEYAAVIGQVEPTLASDFRSLADLYGQIAFARGVSSPQSTNWLQQLWQRWK